jgi:hypothetical protein
MMTNQELREYQQKQKKFNETELGKLFNRFVNLHAHAWQLDERSGDGYSTTASDKAWKTLEPVEKELREKLMIIAGVEE